jgi:hypothetical protein
LAAFAARAATGCSLWFIGFPFLSSFIMLPFQSSSFSQSLEHFVFHVFFLIQVFAVEIEGEENRFRISLSIWKILKFPWLYWITSSINARKCQCLKKDTSSSKKGR